MAETPLVSIILPVYHAEPFLSPCIESLLAQSFDDYELLIIDDGSTDRSREIAEQWARKHPERIRLYVHPGAKHRGVSASRNLGLMRSRGEIIAFQDADDLWDRDKLDSQIRVLQNHSEVGLIFSDYRVMRKGSTRYEPSGPLLSSAHEGHPIPFLETLLNDNVIATPTTVLPRHVLRSVGGFDTSLRTEAEDWLLWLKIATLYPMIYMSRALATLRVHRSNTSERSYRSGRVFMDEHRLRIRLRHFWQRRLTAQRFLELDKILWRRLHSRTWMMSLESTTAGAHMNGAMGLFRFGKRTVLQRGFWSTWARLVLRIVNTRPSRSARRESS